MKTTEEILEYIDKKIAHIEACFDAEMAKPKVVDGYFGHASRTHWMGLYVDYLNLKKFIMEDK